MSETDKTSTPHTSFILSDEVAEKITYNNDGLVPAIIQEKGTGQVLMMAWMNKESLERSLATGRTWFWSRSRKEYWCKGETSGDRQYIREGFRNAIEARDGRKKAPGIRVPRVCK